MVDGKFVLFAGAVAATPEMAAQGAMDALALKEALAAVERTAASTSTSPRREEVDPKNGYDATAWEQLKAIRSVLDPDGVFLSNHVVPRFYENGGPAN